MPGCSSDDDVNSRRIYCVVGNRDRTLYAAVASSVIYICLANVSLLQLFVLELKRAKEKIQGGSGHALLKLGISSQLEGMSFFRTIFAD